MQRANLKCNVTTLGKTDQEQCLQKASIKESGSICAIRTGFCKETMRNNGKQIRK